MKSRVFKSLLLLTFWFAATACSDRQPYPMPDWQLRTLNGETVTAQQLRGQPLVLTFWATWCPYCKKLLPGLQSLQERYARKGLRVVLVNYNEDEGADIAGALTRANITLLNVVKGDELAQQLQIGVSPTTFFVNRDGLIVGRSNEYRPDAMEFQHYAEWLSK